MQHILRLGRRSTSEAILEAGISQYHTSFTGPASPGNSMGGRYICGSGPSIWTPTGAKDLRGSRKYDCVGSALRRDTNHIHYLDGFLLMGAPHTEEAVMALSSPLNVLDHLGFPVATHKTEGSSHCITFLGIVIDTKDFELWLPVDKVQGCKV